MHSINPIFQSLLRAFDNAFVPKAAVSEDAALVTDISDDSIDGALDAERVLYFVCEEGERLVYSGDWSSSDDGTFETKCQVFEIPNGYLVPVCLVSRFGGEPGICRGDEVKNLEDAKRIANELAAAEHCSAA